MSLASVLKKGVKKTRKIVLSLHVSVTHRMWTSETYAGVVTYTDVARLALVERKQRLVKNKEGEEVMSTTYIAILEEITPLQATDRANPVDPRDRFILPDGVEGPVLAVDGFFDGGTGVPFYSQIYLG